MKLLTRLIVLAFYTSQALAWNHQADGDLGEVLVAQDSTLVACKCGMQNLPRDKHTDDDELSQSFL
jgi:hypothetical protein